MFGTIIGLFAGWQTKLLVGVAAVGIAFGAGMYLEHQVAAGKAAEVQLELARQTAAAVEANTKLKEAILARDAKAAVKDKAVNKVQRKKAQDVVKKTPSTPAFSGADADRLRSLFD